MKIRELIFEYKQDITLQNYGEKLVSHLKSFEQKTLSDEKIVSELEKADPTTNKQYMIWIIKQYLKSQFRLEDINRVHELLNAYNQAKPRLPVDQRDINKFTFYQLDDLVDSWSDIRSQSDETNIRHFENAKDIKILYDGPLGFLAIPKTEEASCKLGSGTKWCTAAKSNNLFNSYNRSGNLYVFIERPGNKKYQFHFQSAQFMDDKDRSLSQDKLEYFRTKHPITKKLFAAEEKKILESPRSSISYTKNVIKGRWPEAETYIMKDPRWAYEYTKEVIKDRWPEAEKVIASNPESAYQYAKEVIKDRWPEAEKVIASNPESAYQYAKEVVKGRWPKAEKVIASHPRYAYNYAKEVVKGRWTEGEKAIISDPGYAYYYAAYIIEGRWPEAEKTIASDTYYAYYYAHDIIEGRWPEGEKAIASNPESAYYYVIDIIKGRWPEGEKAIASNPDYAYLYAEEFGLKYDETNGTFEEI